VEYADYEERPERQFVAYFTMAYPPQVCSVRLFATMDRAKIAYGERCRNICKGPSDLARLYDGEKLLQAYNTLRMRLSARTSLKGAAEGPHCEELPEDLRFNRNEMSERVWTLIQEVGDRVRSINLLNELDEDLYVIRLDLMTTEIGMEMIKAYNNQKRIVANGLIELGKSKVTELELTEMMRALVTYGKLKTKQDPMRIFRYYAPELGDDGFVYYPGKRHKREDHALNG
jgi:hypothetical protein